MKPKAYIADLTHTENGIAAQNFPLGASFVASYAKMALGQDFDFRLFKFPDHLSKAILEDPPLIMAMSNYSWNLELTYKICAWAKERIPNLIVVFGGPNYPNQRDDKLEFLQSHPILDFYIENEGELAFVGLLGELLRYDFDMAAMRKVQDPVPNCSYLSGGDIIEGGNQRIQDVNVIPSPYLTGMLDEFFRYASSPYVRDD